MSGARTTRRLDRSRRDLAVLCAALTLALALVPLFPASLYVVLDPPSYLVFHNVAELFGVATSLAIFAVAWFGQGASRDRHALLLGCVFLAVGLLDLMHTLGYTGMPAFVTENAGSKSTQFWVAARTSSAAAFLASAFVDPRTRSRWLSPGLLLAVALAWPALVFAGVTFFSAYLPATYVPGVGLTPFKQAAELATIALCAAAALAYLRRGARSGDGFLALYAAALAVCGLSEILFTVYRTVFDTYNVVGHVYKVVGFALFFRGAFIASVQRPREELLAKEDALRREVAEREAAQAGRARTEEKFAAFAAAADEVFWIQRVEPDGVMYVNPAYERVWGRAVGELLSDPSLWAAAVHADDRARVLEAFMRWTAGGGEGPFDLQYRIVRPGGATRWIADRGFVLERRDGRVHLVAGIARDVTERVQEEEALRESERRFRQRLDAMLEGCMVIGFDWRYLYVNDAAARHGHQRRENLIGRTLQAMYPGIEATAVFARYRRCMEQRVAQRFDSSFQFPDGSTGWFEYSVEPAEEGIFVLSLDVTERRAAEEQLRQSQKLEAVGRLAGGVAHDFNNLLTVIVSGSSLLKESLPRNGPLCEEVKGIEEAAHRAAALTHQLLSFSRRQLVRPKVIDLDGVVEGMGRMLRRLIGEQIELVTRLGASAGRVRADPGELEQVIANLVVNARDALRGAGRIVIETTERTLAGGEAAGTGREELTPGRYLSLTVQDDGCGMTPEVQAHLFEPFFTTKEVGKGTGLGLSTAYGIVKQAGGAIRVRSAPGQGSAFEVLLPHVDEAAEREAAPELDRRLRGSEAILLVEDDAAVRRLAARTLRQAGYAVLEAAHGEEALRVAPGTTFELLLTDVVMPVLGGVELAERLRGQRPGLRVLFMSGYTDDRVGVDDEETLLRKPFTPPALLRRVREALDAGRGTDRPSRAAHPGEPLPGAPTAPGSRRPRGATPLPR